MKMGASIALACAGAIAGQSATTNQVTAGGAAGKTDGTPVASRAGTPPAFLRARPLWPQGRETENRAS